MNQKQKINQKNQKKKKRLKKKLANDKLERSLFEKGYKNVIGIDEVGRGAWAGPVVIVAFVYRLEDKKRRGVADSKLLNRTAREDLYSKLEKSKFHIFEGSVERINKVGIGKTIEEIIKEIVAWYSKDTFFLIDGQFAVDFGERSLKIIKGDMLHYSIACASNIAKVYRDRVMHGLHSKYPEYMFINNVGYPTLEHRKALNKVGPTTIHRKSFKPIALLHEQIKLDIHE